MSPIVATFIWLLFVAGLFYFDGKKHKGHSAALWLPVIWLFIIGSRLPTQWINLGGGSTASAYEDGSPLDRTIYIIMLVLAVTILLRRRFNWHRLLKTQSALILLIAYSLLSVIWSDFPLVSLKRWIRDLGVYLVLLISTTESQPHEAICVIIRRLAFLIVPLSVLLIKYYPEIATLYDPWTGIPEVCGATLSKNMLGVACLALGLYFVWDTLRKWNCSKSRSQQLVLLINGSFCYMIVWLLIRSDSATSKTCLLIGCLLLFASRLRSITRRPLFLKLAIPLFLATYFILEYALGISVKAIIAEALGRNPDLTGRTHIWEVVLGQPLNPLFGVGYEAFWLGPRLREVWRLAGGGLNHSHNGYIELYLNLGLVGIAILAAFLLQSYMSIWTHFREKPLAALGLAFWTVTVFYNITESAFKIQFVFVMFTFTAMHLPFPAGPGRNGRSARRLAVDQSEATGRELMRGARARNFESLEHQSSDCQPYRLRLTCREQIHCHVGETWMSLEEVRVPSVTISSSSKYHRR